MTQQEFNQLSSDLQDLARIIPLKWGDVQNDATDKQIDMFSIHSFSNLEKELAPLDEPSKNYFRRRWFLWKCAKCDEHIFCMNSNVKSNPNPKDQTYDIEFNNNQSLRFDIKGTVIPRKFRGNIDDAIKKSQSMIDFFYEEQSQGVRNNIQNRLFIIHHSYRNQAREMYLRCHWKYKQQVYKEYASKVSDASKFYEYKGVKSDIILIAENNDGSITHFNRNFFF